MNAKIKAGIYGIISLVGNGTLIAMVPDPYKVWCLLAFNIIQVVYGFMDPSYTVHLIQSGQLSVPPPQS